MEYSGYSKINLGLDVIGKREDGYHDLRMVMQTLQLRDLVDIDVFPLDGMQVEMTCSDSSLPVDDSNLCVKAAKLLMEEFNITRKVVIHLVKNIPIAAGMAGGSAEAAAVLEGLNDMLDLGIGSGGELDHFWAFSSILRNDCSSLISRTRSRIFMNSARSVIRSAQTSGGR